MVLRCPRALHGEQHKFDLLSNFVVRIRPVIGAPFLLEALHGFLDDPSDLLVGFHQSVGRRMLRAGEGRLELLAVDRARLGLASPSIRMAIALSRE